MTPRLLALLINVFASAVNVAAAVVLLSAGLPGAAVDCLVGGVLCGAVAVALWFVEEDS